VVVPPGSLPPIPLFSELSRGAFVDLVAKMGLRQVGEGELILQEGDQAASMFIVIQGRVRVQRTRGEEQVVLAELSEGSFFGEMALMSNARRTASVVAIDPTMLFEIGRDLVDEMVRRHPSVSRVMRRFFEARLVENALRTSPIFAPFSGPDRRALVARFKRERVGPDQVVIARDRAGDSLYVLLHGRCVVIAPDDRGREVVLAELRDGDVFGEGSLLYRRSAKATVRAITPCVVLRLPHRGFDELIMTHPQVLETLAKLAEERATYNQELLRTRSPIANEFLL
jgi:CRP-like cAMP-binding protein